jgi:hypothetical protein
VLLWPELKLVKRLIIIACTLALLHPAGAVTIAFDYTYDTGAFFSGTNSSRRTLLDTAAAVFTSRIDDSLTSLTPAGSNSWSAQFYNPATGLVETVVNPTIALDTVLVYVGARNLGGSTLGEGGPGGWSASGSQSWFNALQARGQSGALLSTPTDFGPWGGSLAFDLDTTWYFDSDPATVESFTGKSDFYSVAVHELGHLLGLGTADSWDTWVSGTTFTGAASRLAHSGTNVALSTDLAHWANGTMSTVYGTATAQETAMDPSITVGTRKYFTNLDFAGLTDVGWEIVPEPHSALLFVPALVLILLRRRRPTAEW